MRERKEIKWTNHVLCREMVTMFFSTNLFAHEIQIRLFIFWTCKNRQIFFIFCQNELLEIVNYSFFGVFHDILFFFYKNFVIYFFCHPPPFFSFMTTYRHILFIQPNTITVSDQETYWTHNTK